ncbi:mitochondrial antiviral-signaling protein [Empidonax traillii]|uniref:mitochondrial antiviral-signaling protein n=1 Tax=Empidonax traillii TaxID=164674 RepID=UPI000FFCEC95|nr:mitochondrial antiviral-signaling protein [Empidonax traillii]XP_027759262.1 mitochondrial antiviral-signaling protein [Empidonax traillii]
MGLAEEKVYSHIMRNLRHFGTIHVGSLADSLTCLVDSDRDELHAREEMRGSQATVFKFYQRLRCRKDWVPDLIQALRHNNAGHLADEVQEVYDTWKPRPSAPAPASSLPSNARPTNSSVNAPTPALQPNSAPGAPLAEQPRRDLPVGDHPPIPPSDATTMSTHVEARIPVQESLPKKLPEQESVQPILPRSTVRDGVSGEGPLSHPGDTTQGSVGTPVVASVSVPSAVPPEQGRDWLSRRPVCVDNGCFGNANHLHHGAPGLALGRALPAREPSATHSPERPRNEPEEHSDESTEFPPRLEGAARGAGQQPPNSLPKKQPVPSSEPPSSFVDVRSPLLIQEQFDAEKKRVQMLQEDGGRGDTSTGTTPLAAAPVPRGTSPSHDTSVKSVPEKKPPVGSRAGSTYSMPTEKVFPASAEPLLGTAVVGSSEGTAGRSASRVSSGTSAWASCGDAEEGVELSKPGILVSVAPGDTEVPGRCPGSHGPSSPNSAASDSLGLSSDPILVSSDSSTGAFSRGSLAPAPRADPGGQEADGASRDSRSTPSRDSTSVGIHEVCVDHYPSIQLGAGDDGVGPLRSSPDFDSSGGRGAATSSPQAKVPAGDSNGPSLPYILPAVGIAVISAVAFLVYARLQK